jgi:hypothetical protein
LVVAFVLEIYSFIFIGGPHLLDDRDVAITQVIGSLWMTVVDFMFAAGVDLQGANLVELQRESTGVNVNISSKRGSVSLQHYSKSVYTMLGVLREIWGTWCMSNPNMVQDGLAHEK